MSKVFIQVGTGQVAKFKEQAQDVAVELPHEIRQMWIGSPRSVHTPDPDTLSYQVFGWFSNADAALFHESTELTPYPLRHFLERETVARTFRLRIHFMMGNYVLGRDGIFDL